MAHDASRPPMRKREAKKVAYGVAAEVLRRLRDGQLIQKGLDLSDLDLHLVRVCLGDIADSLEGKQGVAWVPWRGEYPQGVQL